MNSLIGIDIGFGSHFVALATPSNDGATEPRIDAVMNEKKESENKCQVEYNDSTLAVASHVDPIDEKNVKCIAPFTIEYLKADVDLEHEKLYSDIPLEKKNDQIFMTLQTKDSEKELSAAQTMGILLAYDNFCVLNQSGLSADWLLTYMSQAQMKDSLQQMPTLYSIPTSYELSDVSRLRTIIASFNLPESSFVHRSLPIAISACYDLWKKAYDEDKKVTKHFLVFDFAYTCSNVYLVGIQRHHWKIKCHLHSKEANVRALEHAVAEAIRKNSAENKKLWKHASANRLVEELGHKYLSSFFSEKVGKVRVTERDLFVVDGNPVEFVEEVPRKEVIRECKKEHVIEAYQTFIDQIIEVLKQNKIKVDNVIPLGAVTPLDEIRLYLSKAITQYTKEKRLSSPANTPESVSLGTARLLHLIQTQQAAIDPAFLDILFWPNPALQAANQAAWAIPGILKISHTRTNMKMDVKDELAEQWPILAADLTTFVTQTIVDEGYRVGLKDERSQLMKDYERVQRNMQKVMEAVKEAEAAAGEVAKEGEAPKEGEVGEEGEAPKEGEVAKDGEETVKPKSEAMRAVEKEDAELEEILELIQSDKYLRTAEGKTAITQRLTECDQRLHAIIPSVSLEEKVVDPVPTVQEQPKKKRGGCCKGKSDVVEMGPVE